MLVLPMGVAHVRYNNAVGFWRRFLKKILTIRPMDFIFKKYHFPFRFSLIWIHQNIFTVFPFPNQYEVMQSL